MYQHIILYSEVHSTSVQKEIDDREGGDAIRSASMATMKKAKARKADKENKKLKGKETKQLSSKQSDTNTDRSGTADGQGNVDSAASERHPLGNVKGTTNAANTASASVVPQAVPRKSGLSNTGMLQLE